MQLRHRRLQRLEQVAVVQAVDQVHDDFGIGLAVEHIAFGLQLLAQRIVVFDDAVVNQRDAARVAGTGIEAAFADAVAEVGVRVVNGWRAVCGPAGVGNASRAFKVLGADLRLQFGNAGGAACPFQTASMYGDAARVITPVFQALQALNQDGNDVLRRNACHDAAHKLAPISKGSINATTWNMKYVIEICIASNYYFYGESKRN